MTNKPADYDTSILPPMGLTPFAVLFLKLAENLDSTLYSRNYDQAINYTTSAVDQLLTQQLLMVLLDTRAYSYAMQGQTKLAIEDAHKMINYPSMLPSGYLRKADILKMYRDLSEAIQTYEEDLRKTPAEEKNKVFIQQLKNGLKEARRVHNKEAVDFISRLPDDIVNNNIMPHLQQSTRRVCLEVSRVWRKKILGHRGACENLSVDDNNREALRVFNTIPYYEYNIKHLSIDTQSSTVPVTCFQYMRDGHLSKIESFKIKATNTDIQQKLLNTATVPLAFWQIRQTLTTLDLDFGRNANLMTLADLIMTCTNLTKLKFTTTQPLAQLIGNFSVTGLHETLIDLQIKAKLITGQDIEPMLQQGQQLRRLIMNTCDETVFDSINRHADNLEILAYNPSFSIQGLQTKTNKKSRKGLKILCTNNGGAYISAKKILPLIYNNRATLETLYAMISSDWDTTIYAVDHTQHHYFVNTLLGLPVLSELQLAHIRCRKIRSNLFRLFERYRLFSAPNNSGQPTLMYVGLSYCDIISDGLISKLAAIASLHKVYLCSLPNVSVVGLNNMISKLSDRLTYLSLEKMDLITDKIIIACGELKKLGHLRLKSIKNVTNQGIYGFLDKANALILTKLVVEDCPNITESCIATAKKKIKVVEHT